MGFTSDHQLRRLRPGLSQNVLVVPSLLRRPGLSKTCGSSGAGLGSAPIPGSAEPPASRRFWVSGRRPISLLWGTATQAVEPQLIVAKPLIVNYTFGTGTLTGMRRQSRPRMTERPWEQAITPVWRDPPCH